MAVNVNGGALTFDAWINNSQFKAQIDEMEKRLKGLADKANDESKAIEDLAEKAAAAIGTYLSISSATDFIKKMIEVRGEFQQLEVAFTTMLQSKEKADKLLAQVAELSAKTPFGLQDAAQGTKQLLAYGFGAEEITSTLTMLGNVASGVSAPLNDIVYLYGTLRTQGRAYSQDIKQFTGRGIPIIEKLAEQFKVSADKVNDLVGAGKVGFPEIQKAFQSLTAEGGMFFNLMEEQSKTLTGRISNLEDSIVLMLNDLGKSSEGIAYDVISALNAIVDNYQTVLNIIEILIATYGTYRAAVIAVTVVEGIRTALMGVNAAGLGAMTAAELLHYQALVLAEKAQKLLNATMLSNPYVAIATILAAFTTSLIVMHKATLEARDAQELLKESSTKVADSLDKQKDAIDPYVAILKDANSTEQERIAAMEKLAAISPKIVEGLNAQSLSQEKLTENVESYIESLRNKLTLEANQEAVKNSLDLETQLGADVKSTRALLDEYNKKIGDARKNRLPQEFMNRLQTEVERLNSKLVEQTELLDKQKAATTELVKGQIKNEQKKQEEAKKTNAELIKEAKSLEALKMIRDDIDKKYKEAETDVERSQLTKDLQLADARKKELDPYGNIKKSAKAAAKDASQLRQVMDQINQLESQATSVIDSKEEGRIERLTDERDKLLASVKRLNLSSGVEKDLNKRINDAANALIDNARVLSEAKKAQYKLAGNLSDINTELSNSQPNTVEELKLKKQALDAEAALQVQSLKDQYDRTIEGQIALQKRSVEIYAATNRQKQDLDREFARRTTDAQIAAIQRATDRANLKDQRVLNDPTATANQQFEAQQKILERNKKSLEDMKTALYNLKLSGKGDIKEINIQVEELNRNIEDINNQLANNTKARLKQIITDLASFFSATAQSVKELGNNLSALNAPLGAALVAISDLMANYTTLIDIINNKERTKNQNIATAIQAGIALASMAIEAAANRARAEQQFNESLLNQQREYNLALNEAIRLNNKLKDNVFVSDFQGQIKDGIDALTDAQNKYQEAIQALSEGQAKAGLRNSIDGKSILSGVGSGAVLGAAVGSIVPVIGTAIGGVVGGIVGGIVGLFGGKKKKDSYVSLLQEYPELVRQTADGVYEINTELAKTLIANNMVSESTKGLIQDTLDWQEAINKANEQIRGVISDLAGDLGSNLRDALVSAFEEGTSSAQAFADTVEKTLQNVVSQMLFNNIFGTAFDKLQERMEASFGQTGDMNWADDLADFFNQYGGLTDQFNEQLEAAQQAAEQAGLDIFKNQDPNSNSNNLQGAISGMSEQTAEILAGQFGAIRVNSSQQLQIMTQQLTIFNNIERNTAQLFSIDNRLRMLETQGIKIRS